MEAQTSRQRAAIEALKEQSNYEAAAAKLKKVVNTQLPPPFTTTQGLHHTTRQKLFQQLPTCKITPVHLPTVTLILHMSQNGTPICKQVTNLLLTVPFQTLTQQLS
ncbi:Hypothetical predicted protein [Pelobates cultripes]|uniref:Uncharacterized protein n=1 Tax=Pelobates cultripes TaxID=61616 RepID=A0AAD1S7C6_PELCU|nr:Hypothetical predicted protein [Pelobates cultripes]